MATFRTEGTGGSAKEHRTASEAPPDLAAPSPAIVTIIYPIPPLLLMWLGANTQPPTAKKIRENGFLR